MIFRWKRAEPAWAKVDASDVFERYVPSAPSLQNAVDALPGWQTCFPARYGVRAGADPTFHDRHIQWAIECYGSLEGRRVLELGPADGGRAALLEAAGAHVDAIEADRLGFMRCLVTKEIVGLTRSHFWLGDFMEALEYWDRSYDLIVACGVLDQLKEPLRLLELAARRSDAFYFWTHVVTEEGMLRSDARDGVFEPTVVPFHGLEVRAYRPIPTRSEGAVTLGAGVSDERQWLHHDDLIAALKRVGFGDIRTDHHDPNHPNGAAVSILARK